ncbi:MAG: hypothetical protein QOD67_5188 [Caballeronia sp.]|jgi:pyruvate/2-oxoglutarate dehydrogenase complex dihydrolipoamide dehydrogenase (E3) component|nr:hypothetical protein [Caballeronia sp.]
MGLGPGGRQAAGDCIMHRLLQGDMIQTGGTCAVKGCSVLGPSKDIRASPHMIDPRRIANDKLCALRQSWRCLIYDSRERHCDR